jgi:hypothetical protein
VPESHTHCKKLNHSPPYGKRNEFALLIAAPYRRAANDVVHLKPMTPLGFWGPASPRSRE